MARVNFEYPTISHMKERFFDFASQSEIVKGDDFRRHRIGTLAQNDTETRSGLPWWEAAVSRGPVGAYNFGNLAVDIL
jgi:hypothetical protein